MSFQDAVRTVLTKYAVFNGRAGRSEFWYWVVFCFAVSIGLNILQSMAVSVSVMFAILLGFAGFAFSLATIVPGIAVGIRRMHDIGKSGWFVLIPFYNIYLAAQPSDPGANAYG